MTARPGRPPRVHRDTKPENVSPQRDRTHRRDLETWEQREAEIHARAAALIRSTAPWWEPGWVLAGHAIANGAPSSATLQELLADVDRLLAPSTPVSAGPSRRRE